MSSRKPNNSAVKAIKSRLSTRDFWSIHLLWMAIFTYATSTFVLDSIRLSDFSTEWIWIALATFFEALCLSLLVKFATPKVVWRSRFAALYTVICVAIIGGLKNLTVAIIANQLGLEAGIDYLSRFIGGMGLGLAIALATVVFFGSRLDHEATMRKLLSARVALEDYQRNSRNYLQKQTDLMVQDTQSIINPRLEEIEKLIKNEGSIEASIYELRKLIAQGADLVSNKLLRRADEMSSYADKPAPHQTRFFRYRELMHFSLSENLHPRNLWIIFALWQMAIVYVTIGQKYLIHSLISSISLLAGLLMLKLITAKVGTVSPIINLGIITSFSLIITPISLIVLWNDFENETTQNLLIGYSFVDIFITLIGAMFLNVINADRLRLETQAESANQKLLRKTKKFEQELWLTRRRWSYLLHGRVQSLLTIAINRLSSDKKLTPEIIDLVTRDFEQIRNAISAPPQTKINLSAELKELSETWRGVCEVKYEIDRFASELLARDSDAQMAVNEISKEVVSNAYRHGKARTVSIVVTTLSNQEILFTAINNGEPVGSKGSKSDARRGIGSQMLDEIALEWSIKSDRIAQKTEFQAIIAIDSNGPN